MAPSNDNEDMLCHENDTYLIENVSTECCGSTFASSTTPVSADNETGSDNDSNDDVRMEDAAADLFTDRHSSSEDGSCGSDESYATDRSRIGRRCCNCTCVQLFFGALCLLFGVITVHFDLYEFMLNERMKMTPGLPPYQIWQQPTPNITARIFIFAAENHEQFLSGADPILKLKEIGPIVYREHLRHDDVQFHDNSTLSYTPKRWLEFLPDRNVDGILNQTIVVPNFVLLAAASSLNSAYFLKKMGFNAFVRSTKESIFLNTTVYQYLWNYTSPALEKIRTIFPFMVPTDNNGVLYQMYKDSTDRYNVRIGPKYVNDRFFDLVTINGATTVPRFNLERGECDATIANATEGALYNSQLTHDSVLWYWRKALCRQAPLHFTEEVQKGALLAYRYELRPNVYDRLNDTDRDCYKGFFQPLPDGLTDVSKCYYDIPLAASNPHFYGRRLGKLADRISGLNPNKRDHGSYIIVEPITGVPIDQCARSQSNVVTPEFQGFMPEIQLFSNMAVPTFWVEYHLKELTTDITLMLILTVHVLPIVSNCLPVLLLFAGLILVVLGVNKFVWSRNNYIDVRSKSRSTAGKRRSIHAGIIFNNPDLQAKEKELTEALFR